MSEAVIQHLQMHTHESLRRLVEFCSIASVGTNPEFAEHMPVAAKWVADHLRASGLDAEICQTGGWPAIVATTRPQQVANPDAPRVLFYGHYDVQPADPIELWNHDPFGPTIAEGADGPALFARGASDDKGQVACFLEALRAYHDTGEKFPGPVTLIIEGEEEGGSENLAPFVEANAQRLAADICIVCDTSMWDPNTPAITYGLRGMVYFDVKLHGPSRDLHSGVYGGTLANPATMLTHILGKLVDDNHRISIPGFYDDVVQTTDEEFEQWSSLKFDDVAFTASVGATPFGEGGYNTLERRWARPSCDINGLYGGYMQHGAKTVIPSFAGAKVSFRLPPNMDPHKVAKQFTDWLESQQTGGCRWELTNFGEAWPVMTPTDSPYLQAASQAIEAVRHQPPALVREGATIPVVADFKRILNLDTLLIGFGLNSDNIHSPNEHFGLDRFLFGQQALALTLQHIATVRKD